MARSWRLSVERRDRSGTVVANTGIIGAMVIRAGKGSTKPVFIDTGDETSIINYFGAPGDLNASGVTGYTDVYEAIEYNRVGPMWISGPPVASDKMGGVWVIDSGVVPFASGVTEGGVAGYSFPSAIDHTITEDLGSGDTVEDTFTATLDFTVANPLTGLALYVSDVDQEISVAGSAPNYTITGSTLASGTYNSTTKVFTVTFTNPPAAAASIEMTYVHQGQAYFALLSTSPRVDEFQINTEWDNNNKWFNFELSRLNTKTSEYELVDEFSGSKDPLKIDGFGATMYLDTLLDGNKFVQIIMNPIASTITDPTATFMVDDVNFAGGTRSTVIGITEVTAGWAYFQNTDLYAADIFMDPTTLPGVASIFSTLSLSYQQYSSYILKLPMGLTRANAIIAKNALGLSDTNLAVYYNNAKVIDSYNNTRGFWTTLVGRIGQRYALMSDIFNAGAPYFTNENNHGGQLGGGVLELEYSLTETDLQAIDVAGFNPITFKPVYGPMIEGMKTCKTATELSDYSYVAHARLFNYIIRNLIDNVLTEQIGKLNDENHRLLRKTNADLIIGPILSSGYLRDASIICDSTNNTDAVLARREFILDCIVQVTPYSEKVKLRFTNVAQTTTVASVAP